MLTVGYRGRAKVIIGSPLIPQDLWRANAHEAKAVFIVGDRFALYTLDKGMHIRNYACRRSSDPQAADRRTILRAWAINDYDSRTRLYVQVLFVF